MKRFKPIIDSVVHCPAHEGRTGTGRRYEAPESWRVFVTHPKGHRCVIGETKMDAIKQTLEFFPNAQWSKLVMERVINGAIKDVRDAESGR